MSPFSEKIINESSVSSQPGTGAVPYSVYRNTPEEFIQKIQNMLKRLMLLFFLLLSALYGGAQEKRDSVYEFRFVPQKDMFFVPYGNNRAELERLSALIAHYKEAVTNGRMPLFVDGYCRSMSGEAENRAVARTRANRLKSELILHQGLTEKCFVTHNHADKGDWVTVRVVLPNDTETAVTDAESEKATVVVTEKTAPEAENVTVATVTEAGTVVENQIRKNNDAGTGDSAASAASDLQSDAPKYQDLQSAFSLRANLLRWATLTPDLGIEWRINRHIGILVNGSWTSWSWDNKNRRYAIWKVSPEVRYYIGKEKRGFLGAMYHTGEFNYKLGDTGKQGDYQGGGITGGYELQLNRSLSLDFHAAVGYTRAEYDKYTVTDGIRVRQGSADKNYWGINQLGVTLVWKFN